MDATAPAMRCPHCTGRTQIVSSREVSPIFREATYACRNPHCGHTFVCGLEVLRTLSPSAIPNPEIRLPLSSHVRKQVLASQLREHD